MNDIRWKRPIASIEHLFSGGVGYVSDFFDDESFQKTVLDCNDCGEPICMVLYLDEKGQRLLGSTKWMENLDCPAVHCREEPAPPVQDKYSTYEIYQIPATEDCAPYLYLPYSMAKEQLSARDYACVYCAPLEQGMGLEDIYLRHNHDDRPAGQIMRSLSMSDVVVVRNRTSTQAFYVDRVGFEEVPEFAKMVVWQKKKAAQKAQPERRQHDRGWER